MKNVRLLLILFFAASLSGCIVMKKVSYTVELKGNNAGSVTVKFFDIKSDAIGNREFEDDRQQLFEFMLKSEDFIYAMEEEGKYIKSRKLFIKDDKLNGEVVYTFNDISDVEGIVHQDGYYFLTLGLKDSVLATNGVVIYSEEFKRIVWDSSVTALKFEMLSDVTAEKLRELSPYYQPD